MSEPSFSGDEDDDDMTEDGEFVLVAPPMFSREETGSNLDDSTADATSTFVVCSLL